MSVMFLVVCLRCFTDGPLLLSWAGVCVDPEICWSLRRSSELLVVWWWSRCGEPRVQLINLSHIVVNFSLCYPSFLRLHYYYFCYNNCVVDWVWGKRQRCDVGEFTFHTKLSKNESSLRLKRLHGAEKRSTVLFEQQSSFYSLLVVPLKTHGNRTERHRKANCTKKISGINEIKIFWKAFKNLLAKSWKAEERRYTEQYNKEALFHRKTITHVAQVFELLHVGRTMWTHICMHLVGTDVFAYRSDRGEKCNCFNASFSRNVQMNKCVWSNSWL